MPAYEKCHSYAGIRLGVRYALAVQARSQGFFMGEGGGAYLKNQDQIINDEMIGHTSAKAITGIREHAPKEKI